MCALTGAVAELIMEIVFSPIGYRITKKWRENSVGKEYLENIKYYCLVMSEEYIRNHFANIKGYANVIEKRLDDDGCTMDSVLADNAEILALVQKRSNIEK